MNIPNILTVFRLALVPIFAYIFFSPMKNSLFLSIAIFLIAGATDVLDGYIARKHNLITKFGIVMDPLADKLMLVTVLYCLTAENYIYSWVLWVIILKELSMIIGGTLLLNKDMVIPSNIFGKISTFLFYISIFILIFSEPLGKMLIYVAVASAVVAFFNYLNIYNKNVKKIQN
ncbi:CDP-diacylglycerol--glycerol-3-phosphate 3-phosphatidyltransferase [Haloimpatiens lingqiaonensis]|uniref:CDP-diacylglycerol--glycerol-3-phosphate 3-phosphatidyltransferase n=1 Tax=Haloimpatiens lingqiaonensis TaxID=1380675 RepID=UPI0010FDD5B0|nr:CDP-diacylglycerol--glycerol-3-phosphate 3-phosphatidyltransferase [Haloimpatiens lingqiaonensis]